jgi:hypothetical protein
MLDLQRAILGAATRAARNLDTSRGVPVVNPLVNAGPNLFDSLQRAPEEAPQFSTGYDTGTGLTTIPFTTDVSLFLASGDDHILTG